MKSFVLGAVALTSLLATTAIAQTAPAGSPQINAGPAIPGVCVFFNQQLLAQSTAGLSVQSRMRELALEVDGELQPYAAALQRDAQELQAGQSTIPADQLQSRRAALQQRAQEAQQLEETRTAELRYTLNAQREAISQAVEPILVTIYQERGCGILIDRESVFVMNPAMDITPSVIERLNTALPSLSFNRLPVPVQIPQQ
jgi:outer membrane protein